MAFQILSERVTGAMPKAFRAGGKKHYYVRIYLQPGENDNLYDIASVQYHLHPTFRDRVQVATDPGTDFEIKIWTYGYFPIEAVLVLRNGQTQRITGDVRFLTDDG